ncbi:hypothetical protein AMI01nite_39410 [Aneurinibacillus migulanus]|nr:hypothetical protein AMI01nite_39410 [Aneurinibacillus migulanus]
MGPSPMKKANKVSNTTIEFVMMDAGHDQLKNYEAAHELNVQALIPLNLRKEKEPPTGFSSYGPPRCSLGFDMVHWGTDNQYLKFRCPHAVGKSIAHRFCLVFLFFLWNGCKSQSDDRLASF